MKRNFSANGKLLLSGEYAVLDGAVALAVPTQLGQQLEIFDHYSQSSSVYWRSLDHEGNCWFEGKFTLPELVCQFTTDEQIANQLQRILHAIHQLNPHALVSLRGQLVQTLLDFPREWGLGTSSTLIYMLAQWAEIDAWQLLKATFGGSGYDLACAKANSPILYQRLNGQGQSTSITFDPPFKSQLYFVYLGRKQNSREGIARYRKLGSAMESMIQHISAITQAMLEAKTLSSFESLIRQHEQLISGSLALTRAKQLYFDDYWGEVKSLGAWGGDFVLLTNDQSEEVLQTYLSQKGFDTYFSYAQLLR